MTSLYLERMNQDKTEEIGKLSAALSLVEIGLGSFLHSLNIPLAGHILSINQIAFLSRISFKLKSAKPGLQVSLIAAILKSLSPAGKKLTPMLAISAQGLFFYTGLFLFGVNYLGLFLAVLLSCLWAFIQPVLFIYLLFGKNSVAVADYYLKEIEKIIPGADHYILWIVVGVIVLKFIIAFVFSLIAIKIKDLEFEKFQKKMLLEIKAPKLSQTHSHAYLALRDLMNPLFIISFALTVLFFFFSNSSASAVQIVWMILRPFAVGFILYYVLRVYPVEKLSNFLRQKGFIQLAKNLDVAIKAIQETRGL